VKDRKLNDGCASLCVELNLPPPINVYFQHKSNERREQVRVTSHCAVAMATERRSHISAACCMCRCSLDREHWILRFYCVIRFTLKCRCTGCVMSNNGTRRRRSVSWFIWIISVCSAAPQASVLNVYRYSMSSSFEIHCLLCGRASLFRSRLYELQLGAISTVIKITIKPFCTLSTREASCRVLCVGHYPPFNLRILYMRCSDVIELSIKHAAILEVLNVMKKLAS